MVKVNPHYERLKRPIIFPVIEQKLKEFKGNDLINLGIGDVALPLAFDVAQAVSAAMVEMSQKPIGYGPAEGYLFLRRALLDEYSNYNIGVDEIFISDGINTDLANIADLFDPTCKVATIDPGYPVFGDSSLLAGKQVITLPCVEENNFIPKPPSEKVDVIYLCSPGNPTGVAMTRTDLEMWVAYAQSNDAIILFDAAYAGFITSPDVPKSIYEIEGAQSVAIEMRSFSKSAGFTGLRCSYSVIPEATGLTKLWKRRQNTKYNGCSYPVQCGALQALKSEESSAQVKTYLQCAGALKEALGQNVYGGINSPYLWWKVPDGMSSWEFFDVLLQEHHILGIPGVGFGSCGEGFVRLSAFTTMDKIKEVTNRLGAYAH